MRPSSPRSLSFHSSALLAALRLGVLVAGVAAIALTSSEAAAQTKVAVRPFNGPPAQAAKAKAEVLKALRKQYEVIPDETWDSSAAKLFAQSNSADDIAAVANAIGAQVVITGAVKKDPGWILVVTVRHGPTGKPVDKLRYQLPKSGKIDPATLRKLPDDLPPLVDKAVANPDVPAAEESPGTTTPGSETPALGEDKEAPLEKKEEKPTGGERPAWAPFFDASAGFILGGRNFEFDEPNLPQFHSAVAPGVRIDATGYPLAFLAGRPGAAMNAIQGIGVGVTYDMMFWPDSIPCTARDMAGNCVETTDRYATSEYRLEAGLRWHWYVQKNASADPKVAKGSELLAEIQYGIHSFSVQKMMDGTDVGPPDVNYSYLTIGVGGLLRIPKFEMLGILAKFNYHIVLDAGDIHAGNQYGPGGVWALRTTLGLEGRVWKGLTVRLAGYYEHFGIGFDNPTVPSPVKGPSTGATDQYYGGWLSVGYQY